MKYNNSNLSSYYDYYPNVCLCRVILSEFLLLFSLGPFTAETYNFAFTTFCVKPILKLTVSNYLRHHTVQQLAIVILFVTFFEHFLLFYSLERLCLFIICYLFNRSDWSVTKVNSFLRELRSLSKKEPQALFQGCCLSNT